MKKANYNWQLSESQAAPTYIEENKTSGIAPLVSEILWQRNVRTKAAVEKFLKADLADLYDPFLMYDMEKAVARIQEAVLAGEEILIYGDYDADGITSTTIMKETLEMLGANVTSILPNRFTHGYGPNKELFAEKIAAGMQLIITVDNGVAGHEALAYAKSQGVDVIVTDHHELPQELPEAYAIVHPRHPLGEYPFGELAGVGVAFKVATALLEEVPVEFLDLVAIGTVADLVSLTDENRILVANGLKQIKQGDRAGIQALLTVSGVKTADVTETSIGFSLAPRLNAIGRLGDPNPGVELLSTFDETEAEKLAQHCDAVNTERKKIVEETTKEALALIDPTAKIQVIAKAGWHEGILGIVAGNILKQTGHPAIVLTIKEDGSAKGSGRSIEGFNLYAALLSAKELFTHFGGHHAAVGLTLPKENLPLLKEALRQYLAENNVDLDQGQTLRIDHTLTLDEVSLNLLEQLSSLAPFGTDNPLPHFLFQQVEMQQLRQIGADKQHLKFTLSSPAGQLGGVAFGFGQYYADLKDTKADCVGTLAINEWQGKKMPQLLLTDFKVSGLQVFDWRGKQHPIEALAETNTLFVAFQKQTIKLYQEKMPELVLFEDLPQLTEIIAAKDSQQIAFVDCPLEKETVKEIVLKTQLQRVFIHAATPDNAYLTGLGSRSEYGLLYRFIQKQKRVDVRNKLPQVAQYLKVSENLLVFMIQVFFDSGFVTIEDGLLLYVENPQKVPLEESSKYQNRKKQISSEEFFVLSDTQTIRNWLMN